MGTIKEAILICVAIVLPVGSWATLPLITDDTGTQGRGKFQLEAAGDYDRDKEIFGGVTVKQTDCFITPTLTYGIHGYCQSVRGIAVLVELGRNRRKSGHRPGKRDKRYWCRPKMAFL